ncbi:Zn-ribbon domain-containing OB-fold protein [Halolamina litorea]|uniref:Zn-ribbon domain-containing OB-fold protein n=1 Tax=Halolamina litorea TaxID=1515593 RepID=A0ABD6BNK6_9EURY|nr:OB-fold domain-containing protein [Halolamina litorea]
MSDAGFDEWLHAFVADDGYYVECANGHGHLPPRRICPDCGSTAFSEEALPESGTVETITTVHVAAPSFESDAPYDTAVVDFGPARVTGIVVDAPTGAVEIGDEVEPDVGASETTGDDVLVLRPV